MADSETEREADAKSKRELQAEREAAADTRRELQAERQAAAGTRRELQELLGQLRQNETESDGRFKRAREFDRLTYRVKILEDWRKTRLQVERRVIWGVVSVLGLAAFGLLTKIINFFSNQGSSK